VVVRIGDRALRALRRAARLGDKGVPAARAEVVTAIEQLGDIALHSVENRDKGIALAAIAALAGFTEQSLTAKPTLPATWFATDALVATVDQDFASMHPDVMKALEIKRTWLEMKVLRQLQAVFEEGLEKMRDMCHLVAIRTRLIAVHAAEIGDDRAIGQALMFLNTFMRAALNHQDQRTAYNLLSEYRLLAEDLLRLDRQAIVVELALRCKYYGQLAFRLKLPFVLETVAFDLTAVLERANVLGSPCQDQLLDILLEIDRAPESDTAQDAGLRGVCPACVHHRIPGAVRTRVAPQRGKVSASDP
jgi:AraC-like DNA-binding protein